VAYAVARDYQCLISDLFVQIPV